MINAQETEEHGGRKQEMMAINGDVGIRSNSPMTSKFIASFPLISLSPYSLILRVPLCPSRLFE
jgi:hypothetical protein